MIEPQLLEDDTISSGIVLSEVQPPEEGGVATALEEPPESANGSCTTVLDDAAADDAAAASSSSVEILRLPPGELKRALEAMLFAAPEPVPVRALAEVLGATVHDVREAAEELRDDYVETGRAFRLEDVAGGLVLLTVPAYDPWVRRLHQRTKDARLSGAALETLAVIAYKQPITKPDLENIRGVQCAPILKTLLDRGLVQVVGRDESLGRPLLYGTSRRFLESFGLPSLRELPQPDAVMPRDVPPPPVVPSAESDVEAVSALSE
jgi:segregation and condensation protein B